MTVKELQDKLAAMDPNHTVHAYEGPGCWITVHDANGKEVAAWETEPA